MGDLDLEEGVSQSKSLTLSFSDSERDKKREGQSWATVDRGSEPVQD
jgi:hypothetical protein